MMIAILCVIGCSAGFLLVYRVPVCPPANAAAVPPISIIIPARNEERNLPRLLDSLRTARAQPVEVLVVDDQSTDNTAAVADAFGANLIRSEPLPAGWKGKAWACHQGALQATGDLLLFLDADTWLQPGGLDRIVSCWARERDPRLVMSLLPYHETVAAYEQLSLIFNTLMAAGAGGFGVRTAPRLFGQSLLIHKRTYFDAGGHAAVRNVILENLRFAKRLVESGALIRCFSGRGTLHMRMFPEGPRQMSESWAKAFVQGMQDSGSLILAYSVTWISALWMTVIMVAISANRAGFIGVYLILAAQLAWIARRFGNFRLLTCLIYPLPLGYYCGLFAQSALSSLLNRKTVWRGREV